MYSEIAGNKRKTWVILALFVLFIALIGYILSRAYNSPSLVVTGFIFATVYALLSYYGGMRLSLAVNGAKEIQKSDNPPLWRIIENLSITEGVPMPRVFVMPDPAPNAFATGRNPENSAVCVTQGLLDIMTKTELEGVLAHEIGHVRNYDIRVSMIAFALSAVVSVLADFVLRMTWFRGSDDEEGGSSPLLMVFGIVAALVAPLVATMIQLAISRKREYLADATGAMTTRYPEGLASALEKIEQVGSVTQTQNTSTAHLFFANPLKSSSISNLFSTHPPIADRIARLREMGSHV
jgi:heat shock protein HtpX